MAPAAARRRGGDGAAVLRQGFAKLLRRRRGVGEGRGCALDVLMLPSPRPSIYRRRGKGLSGPCLRLMGHRASRLVLLLLFFCFLFYFCSFLFQVYKN